MSDIDLKFERFERYFGDSDNVKKIIDQCNHCGAKLLLSHLPDYKNLLVQETSRCLECGKSNQKTLHVLN